jgi:hypothetical protein
MTETRRKKLLSAEKLDELEVYPRHPRKQGKREADWFKFKQARYIRAEVKSIASWLDVYEPEWSDISIKWEASIMEEVASQLFRLRRLKIARLLLNSGLMTEFQYLAITKDLDYVEVRAVWQLVVLATYSA